MKEGEGRDTPERSLTGRNTTAKAVTSLSSRLCSDAVREEQVALYLSYVLKSYTSRSMQTAQWLRASPPNRTVAGSIAIMGELTDEF
ncbi:hypothetical protein EVAR_52609_1 [Eumeta japonica]|uniref:Uncharacterized protein n=1 Tax=Eumeta variegata TaxID=151549 RepID=A0A4C1YP74_EUMVA|nr:hypothetical protein EVAR_52609_1 [Eumeta japonica]